MFPPLVPTNATSTTIDADFPDPHDTVVYVGRHTTTDVEEEHNWQAIGAITALDFIFKKEDAGTLTLCAPMMTEFGKKTTSYADKITKKIEIAEALPDKFMVLVYFRNSSGEPYGRVTMLCNGLTGQGFKLGANKSRFEESLQIHVTSFSFEAA